MTSSTFAGFFTPFLPLVSTTQPPFLWSEFGQPLPSPSGLTSFVNARRCKSLPSCPVCSVGAAPDDQTALGVIAPCPLTWPFFATTTGFQTLFHSAAIASYHQNNECKKKGGCK